MRDTSKNTQRIIKMPAHGLPSSTSLIKKLQSEIKDISEAYTYRQLEMIYEAVFGDDYVIPMQDRKPRWDTEVEVESREIDTDANRKKIRIDLTTDLSYATPLFEHLAKFDLDVQEIKTGLAVKHVVGDYRSNIANFNELRTIYGVLHGNLYLNQVKSDEDYARLNIPKPSNYFRGYIQLTKVSVYEVIDFLCEENIEFLCSLNNVSNKRRLTRKDKLLKTY